MSPDRWSRIEEVFETAADLSADLRESFLLEACGGDVTLRQEVESLLAFDLTSADSIRSPVESVAARMTSGEEHDYVGRRVGPWRIKDLIGQGGMGVVYLAVRDDDQYQQQAAIKCIKRGLDTDLVQRRFRHERQILASLEHPNIARLLDGGTADNDLPYFVMEYVAGKSITRYCDEGGLSLLHRLKLFRQVCEAVQHAHRHMVVHRDLKPDNILVTAEGVPKLLDFGIAKLLDPSSTGENSASLTMTNVRIFTPLYASPEQIRGGQISAATDIYALGAILFELLTGQKAHAIKGLSPLEADHAICVEETVKPSVAVSRKDLTPEVRKLRSQLAGDLDTIVLRALHKEPDRRYNSVEQFSEDLRLHMEGLPVQARKDTLGYRTAKFVRRNYLPLAAVLAVLVSLVAGIVVSVGQARLAQEQARRADLRFQQVRKLANSVLFDFHDEIRNLPGSTRARAMLVKTALEYLDTLSRETQSDGALLDDLASAYEKVSEVQSARGGANLGDTAGALSSISKAVELRERLVRGSQAAPDSVDKLASSLLLLGSTLEAIGQPTQAMATYQRSVVVSRTMQPTLRTSTNILQADGKIGYLLLYQGNPGEALVRFRASLAVGEKLAAQNPNDLRLRRMLTSGHTWVGIALGDPDTPNMGDSIGAEASFRKALAIAESVSRAEPENARYARDVAMTWQRLGSVQRKSRRLPEALLSHGRMLSIFETLAAHDPANAEARRDMGCGYAYIGDVWFDRKEWRKALQYYMLALPVLQSLVDHDPANARGHTDLAEVHINLGATHRILGHSTDFIAHYREAISGWEILLSSGMDNADIRGRLARAHAGLGESFAASGQWPLAQTSYSKSLNMLQELQRRGALAGEKQGELVRIRAELARCDVHVAKPSGR